MIMVLVTAGDVGGAGEEIASIMAQYHHAAIIVKVL
jgi:hypothetical protein